jgi:non-homologous end joining protein Ku
MIQYAKEMTISSKRRQDKRTTISLAQVVWDMAEEMMEKKGFNDNFSAYIADLIRRDKEKLEAGGRYPEPGRSVPLKDRAKVSSDQTKENDAKALALLKKSVATPLHRPKQ